jgi:hypothetical protein
MTARWTRFVGAASSLAQPSHSQANEKRPRDEGEGDQPSANRPGWHGQGRAVSPHGSVDYAFAVAPRARTPPE